MDCMPNFDVMSELWLLGRKPVTQGIIPVGMCILCDVTALTSRESHIVTPVSAKCVD